MGGLLTFEVIHVVGLIKDTDRQPGGLEWSLGLSMPEVGS